MILIVDLDVMHFCPFFYNSHPDLEAVSQSMKTRNMIQYQAQRGSAKTPPLQWPPIRFPYLDQTLSWHT